MDSNISEKEALILKEHVGKCSVCYEDFLTYDEILDEFSSLDNILTAPVDFEDKIMAKIYALGDIYFPKESKYDGFMYAVWGGVSVLCGLGMLLILNKDVIINYFNSSPALNGYVKYFAPVENYVIQFKSNVEAIFNAVTSSVGAYTENLKFASFVAFIVLVMAQIFIYKRDKVEVQ